MTILTVLEAYKDDRGNEILFSGRIASNIRITFTGSNNRLVVAPDAKLAKFAVQFDCDNGYFEIGGSDKAPAFGCSARIGQDAKIIIGRNVSATSACVLSAVEGVAVLIGNDVMFASSTEVRSDDGHPIFDVQTGKRLNHAKSITVGDHVWIAGRAVLLGGAEVGSGSVIGFGSVLKRKVPNNCIAVGAPAKVTRRNVAWERPHLSLTPPFYKPDSASVAKSNYWRVTEGDEPAPIPDKGGILSRLRQAVAAF